MVAERAIRPFTVKRKGSMFYSSEKGIKNTAKEDMVNLVAHRWQPQLAPAIY